MNAIAITPLEFAPGEFFRTTSSSGDFPRFIATSAFFISLGSTHLIQLTAVERPVRLSHQGHPLVVREFSLTLPESLEAKNYSVGGGSSVSLSINVDGEISEAAEGIVTLNPQFDEKLGGSFHVTIQLRDTPGKTFKLEGEFNVKLSLS